MDDPALSDHCQTDGSAHPPGTYRVVGINKRWVTPLRVADEAGRRVHMGEVVRVARADLDVFAPVEAPPDDRSPTGVVALGYWSVRAFAGELVARPRVTVAALALVVVGSVGPLSAPLAGSLVLAGSLLLAYVGGGQLRG